jgi:hypothetical protein|tara:strand:- start:1497 stop:1715 length:219 start_codon:yes stop_codon:yes gene_type:complete
MDKIAYEEITSVLAMFGRPDLIAEFKEHVKVDEDYTPPKYTRREKLSDSEGSAVSEEEYEIEEDENGFQSLK